MKKVRGKRYQQVNLNSDVKELAYNQAVEAAKKASYAKFNARLDLTINLGVDPAKTEQRINFTTTLPFSTGKTKRIIAIVNPDKKQDATAAGAQEVGGVELIDKISNGWLDFDVAVATPDMMPELAKVAKILGPKGLMPNPKSGTVSPDPASAIKSLMQGQINVRSGESAVLHISVGNDTQKTEEIVANIEHLLGLINSNRPAKIKGQLIKSAFLSPTMGPSFRLLI